MPTFIERVFGVKRKPALAHWDAPPAAKPELKPAPKAPARSAAPVVAALRARAEVIRRAELERQQSKLDALGPEAAEIIEAITKRTVAKLLHEPTVRVKQAAGSPRGERLSEALRNLFDL